MTRVYRDYNGIKITCLRTPLSIGSDYYNTRYLFKLDGNLNIKFRLKDVRAKIDEHYNSYRHCERVL
jgi:hypothetical protein